MTLSHAQNKPLNLPPSRARISRPDCPVCHGAGRLPSMQVAGLTNPCPRCTGSLVVPDLPPPVDPPRERRHTDRSVGDVLAALVLGLCGGAGLALLLDGLFRVFA